MVSEGTSVGEQFYIDVCATLQGCLRTVSVEVIDYCNESEKQFLRSCKWVLMVDYCNESEKRFLRSCRWVYVVDYCHEVVAGVTLYTDVCATLRRCSEDLFRPWSEMQFLRGCEWGYAVDYCHELVA